MPACVDWEWHGWFVLVTGVLRDGLRGLFLEYVEYLVCGFVGLVGLFFCDSWFLALALEFRNGKKSSNLRVRRNNSNCVFFVSFLFFSFLSLMTRKFSSFIPFDDTPRLGKGARCDWTVCFVPLFLHSFDPLYQTLGGLSLFGSVNGGHCFRCYSLGGEVDRNINCEGDSLFFVSFGFFSFLLSEKKLSLLLAFVFSVRSAKYY